MAHLPSEVTALPATVGVSHGITLSESWRNL